MDQVIRLYETVRSDEISLFFSCIILGWLAIAIVLLCVPAVARRNGPAGIIALTPNGLATLGVLGTFLGILLGLLDFDIDHVNDSVPHLLAGLKIAFTTSVVGMTSSLAFRILLALIPRPVAASSVTPAHIHDALCSIAAGQEGMVNRLEREAQALRAAVQSGQKETLTELRSFTTNMADNNQQAIVEALGKVVSDFNTNLTDQFGQNFVQLNEAVFSLVQWQEQYREHLEGLEKRHRATASALAMVEHSMGVIRSHSERIPRAIGPLGPVLEGLATQNAKLEAQLAGIAEMRDKAVGAFPIIEKNLEQLTTHLERSIHAAVTRSESALEASAASQEQVQKDMAEYLLGAKEASQRFSGELEYTLGQMATRTSEEFARHRSLIQASAGEAQKAIQDSWTESRQKLSEIAAKLDDGAQKDIGRILQLLEERLAGLCRDIEPKQVD